MKALETLSEQPLRASRTVPQIGQVIGGRYRLEQWVERGAMGSVWRAQQVRLRSKAAIKFLEPDLIEVPEMLERFLQEARSAAAVQSAHVIQVFDYGSEGGLPYIAMEFLEGENLHVRLARRGVLSAPEFNKIFRELARGLGLAHALGVIHRDVKPANVFLAREGRHEITKLIDFGIAKVKAEALRVSQVIGTELGTVLGTPQYMSPEQIRGRSTLDHRTDLWALAIIACECLTGRYPFSGTTIGDLTVQICTEEPCAPSSLGAVPDGFDAWFFKATRKDPRDRFASASEMAEALSKILAPAERAVGAARPRLLLVPVARAVRRAWSGASGYALELSAFGYERACALGARVAVLSRLELPRFWSRTAAVGLALMVVVAGFVLLRSRSTAPAPSLVAQVQAPVIEAVSLRSSSASLLAVPPPPSPPASAPLTRPALPVLTPEELPLAVVPPAVDIAPKAAKAPVARRRDKKESPPSESARSAPTPLGPMSVAMQRMGALIAQGGEPRRSARAAAASPRSSAPARQRQR